MRALILVAGACLAVSACTTPTVNDERPAVAVSDAVVIQGTNALADAADAYSVLANSLAVAIRGGAFNTEQIARIQTLNNQARALISGANTTLSVAQRAAALTTVLAQLRSFRGQ